MELHRGPVVELSLKQLKNSQSKILNYRLPDHLETAPRVGHCTMNMLTSTPSVEPLIDSALQSFTARVSDTQNHLRSLLYPKTDKFSICLDKDPLFWCLEIEYPWLDLSVCQFFYHSRRGCYFAVFKIFHLIIRSYCHYISHFFLHFGLLYLKFNLR